jgi:predicted nucleic acid-binding protein
MTPEIAESVADLLWKSKNVELINPEFRWGLITADPDDNKFVDCAIAADAELIVTNDKHFDALKTVSWPKLTIIKLKEFAALV